MTESDTYAKQTHSEQHQAKIGKNIANMLRLKETKKRYNTTWGTKTALGLYLSIMRIIRED